MNPIKNKYKIIKYGKIKGNLAKGVSAVERDRFVEHFEADPTGDLILQLAQDR